MLYYKDTKLRNRRKSREGYIYIYSTKIPLTRAPISVAYNNATIFCRGSTLALLCKLLVIKKYINKHLNKGFIYFSIFLVAAPIRLIKKLGGGI